MKEFIIKYWIEVLFSMIIGLLGYCTRNISRLLKSEMADQKSIRLGVQAMLRDRLIQSYNFHMKIGFCEIHDRDNVINMYEQYHNLGANGVVDKLKDEILDLPTKKED